MRVRAHQHGHDLGDRERRLDPAVLQAVLEQHVRDGLHLGGGRVAVGVAVAVGVRVRVRVRARVGVGVGLGIG